MIWEGGCDCGAIRYLCDGAPIFKGLCLCATCQKISGGAGNMFMVINEAQFRYMRGRPKAFARADSPNSPIREFCGRCGVHLAARSPRAPGFALIKIGTLDDPGLYGGPTAAVWTSEKQPFHLLPPDLPQHPGFSEARLKPD